jgi:hypothetical protein
MRWTQYTGVFGAFAAVATIACATGGNSKAAQQAPDTVDSLDQLVIHARDAWLGLQWTTKEIQSDTNKYEIRTVPYAPGSQEVCCHDSLAITDRAKMLYKDRGQYEKQFAAVMKRIRIVSRDAAPAPWATALNRCTGMDPSDAAISCLTQALALRPAPADAPNPDGKPPTPAP